MSRLTSGSRAGAKGTSIAGLPILHVAFQWHYDPQALAQQIAAALAPSSSEKIGGVLIAPPPADRG
jgi:hypothetical protein